VFKLEGRGSLSLITAFGQDGALMCSWTRDLTPSLARWIGPMSSVSKSPGGHRVRELDLAVSAEAIMTSTAATTMAMIQRTQSMPELPLPPKAV
jgi:hypothetical protein